MHSNRKELRYGIAQERCIIILLATGASQPNCTMHTTFFCSIIHNISTKNDIFFEIKRKG